MMLFLSLRAALNEARSIDSGTAWTIIGVLAGVIATMAIYIVAQQKRHEKKVSAMGEKINEQYDKRIEDMKDTLELVSTLEKVVYKERKGGK